MRINTDDFDEFNDSKSQQPRFVIEIDFSTDGTDLHYFTSHDDVPTVTPVTHGVLKKTSSISQKLVPERANSSIGSLSFDLLDVGQAVTTVFNSKRVSRKVLFGKRARLYIGFSGMDWADYRLEQTQFIDKKLKYKNGVYSISCKDSTYGMNKSIMQPLETRLSSSILAADTDIPVYNVEGWQMVERDSDFLDAPNTTCTYLEIDDGKNKEYCRVTAIGTSFTVVRGVLGTTAIDWTLPVDANDEKGPKVKELIFVQMSSLKLAYAVLTGELIGQTGVFPPHWHVGIDTSLLTESEFTDQDDFTAYAVGLQKTDAKKFIEAEIMLPNSRYLRVNGSGGMDLKRLFAINSEAAPVFHLDDSQIIKHGDLEFDSQSTFNKFEIDWSYDTKPKKPEYRRKSTFIFQDSVTDYGEQLKSFKFRLINGVTATTTTLLNLINSFADRLAGEAARLKVSTFSSNNNLEVGDVGLITHANIINFNTGTSLNDSMQVISTKADQTKGIFEVELFGSTYTPEPLTDGTLRVLNDSFYTVTDNALPNVTANQLTTDTTLTGGDNHNNFIFEVDGDLTIPDGTTLTITDNVQLRIRGQLTVLGTIDCSGNGRTTGGGFVGTSIGHFGARCVPYPVQGYLCSRTNGQTNQGQYEACPTFDLSNPNGLSFLGVPDDLRGSAGALGGASTRLDEFGDPDELSAGGTGNASGSACVVVCRGMSLSGNGIIKTSGVVGNAAVADGTSTGGHGGHSTPGAFVVLLDGGTSSIPDLVGRVEALSYDPSTTVGKDIKQNATRVQFLPQARNPVVDDEIPDGADGVDGQDGNSVAQISIHQRASSAPATPTGGSYNFTNNTITPPSGWSASIPAGTDPVYTSYAIASINGTSGTDSSITWGSPEISFQNGSDGTNGTNGSNGSDGGDGLSVYQATIFRRSASAPATPAANSASYNFGTNTLTPPTNWFTTPPAGTDPLYSSVATFSIAGTTGTDSTQTWSTPALFVQDGSDGSDGTNGLSTYQYSIYRRASSAPATPTGGSFNFGTNTPTAPTNWFTTVPAGTDPVYISTALASVSGDTGTDSDLGWSSPAILSQDGADGIDGQDAKGSILFTTAEWSSAISDPMGGWYVGSGQLTNSSVHSDVAGPFGDYPLTLRIVGNNTNQGWFSQWRHDFGYSSEKSYVFYTWVRRVGSTANGLYFGFTSRSAGFEVVQDTSGTPSTNPYFVSNRGSEMTLNEWYLAVGVIYPDGFGGGDAGLAGIYDQSGVRVYDGQEFQWNGQELTTAYLRLGFYDNVAPTVPASDGFEFTRSTAWVRDGFEPSIEAVLGAGALSGSDGNSVAQLTIYRRSASAPANPTGGSFNFGTNTITPPANWSSTIPAGTDPVYASHSIASINGASGTDSSLSWSSADLIIQNGEDGTNGTNGTNGSNGANGSDGRSTYQAMVFRRSASAPATPAANSGSYNFGTNTLTPPSGWSINPPAGSNPLYSTIATFSIIGNTGTDSTQTWSVPELFVQDGQDGSNGSNGSNGSDGDDGVDGLSTYFFQVFRRASSAPGTPSGGSFNFGSNSATAPTNWSTSHPAGTDPIYVSSTLASIQGDTGTDSSLTWSTPELLVRNGEDGEDGLGANPILNSTDDPQTGVSHTSVGNSINVTWSYHENANGFSGSGDPPVGSITVNLRRNSTIIDSVVVSANSYSETGFWWWNYTTGESRVISDTPGSGTHTYDVTISGDSSTNTSSDGGTISTREEQ